MKIAQKRNMINGKNPLCKIHSEPRSKKHCENISNSKKGKAWSWTIDSEKRKIVCAKISKSLTNKKFSDAHKVNLSKALKGIPNKMKGKKHSEEFCLKLRKPKTNTDNMKGPRNTKTCPHCNLTASSRNITVYHMDNCFMSPSNIPILTLDKNIHADTCFTVAEISRMFNISAALISHLIKINKIQLLS